MTADLELTFNRKNTTAFIAARPSAVILNRRAKTPNGSGGYVLGPATPLVSQVMRLIPMQPGAVERQTQDGKVVTPGYALLAVWDANMQRGDLFTLGGRRYEVVFIAENRDYETKGEVVYLG